MNLNYRGLFVLMGIGNKSCKDDLFSCIFQAASAAITTSSQMQSEYLYLTLHLYRKMSHQKSCQGVRYYWRAKWTSKKPNCYRRGYIPDFAATKKKKKKKASATCLIPCPEWFFWGKKARRTYQPVSWQAAELGPHGAPQESEQGQM